MTCDCERGGPCRKVTVCHMEDAIEEAVEEATAPLLVEVDDLKAALADADGVIERSLDRLAEAERLLQEAREPVWVISTLREASVLQSRDRDRLKALVTSIDAFLAKEKPT